MKRLEDIDKKNVFRVPEGYFDQLPTVIQSRIAEKHSGVRFGIPRIVWQYAAPALVVIAAFFWFYPSFQPAAGVSGMESGELIASVDTESLIAYLEVSEDLEFEDILEFYAPDEVDIAELELSTYTDLTDEGILDDHTLELLESEYGESY